MDKQKLTKLAREHIELPDDEKLIEYDFYDGCSSLSFYNYVYHWVYEKNVEYLVTVVCDGNKLEINAVATEPMANHQDRWHKIIEL